jgi:Fe-S oxidoreductase
MSVDAPFPFARYFGEIDLLAALQFKPGEKPFNDRAPRGAQPKDLLLYLGCNVLRTAHLAKTAIAVLRAMGFDFNAVGGPAHCCGIIHHNNGEPDTARAVVANSLRHFAAYRPRHVIMWCPSCNEHYDDVVAPRRPLPFPYEHMTAFVARHLDRVRFVRRVPKTVALHYHTGHPQQDCDRDSTRAILRAIPGVTYVDIENPTMLGRHCSPAYMKRIGRATWEEAITGVMRAGAAAGVDVLATIYHSCQREICDQEARYPFEIVNYVSLLGEAMGIEHPDVYKRYRLMGDVDAIFEDVREYVDAHGLDAAHVRQVLTSAFAPPCESVLPNPS